ncbi:MAG: hypothetical protein GXX84_14095 [Acidobacteria bacterium]|nr:hypothetical protein [Acidobacteriota bacterium]
MSTFNPNQPKPASKSLIPDSLKTVLIFVLLLMVGYLFIDGIRTKRANQAEMAKMASQIESLESSDQLREAALTNQLSSLKNDLEGAHKAVGSTKAELKKTAQQIQEEGRRTRNELAEALASKADSSQVEAQVMAARTEAERKIVQVTDEVGGVKTEVVSVKNELDNTRRDLEGTQRQLLDVRDSLSEAVAKNSSELAQLRLKGERDYFEFTLPKKKQQIKVEDIRLVLTKTNPKKGKFNIKVLVDDNQLEKKDKLINEPIQFLVGQNRVRYEIVINWVQKDKAGGYLSIPKDRTLSAERSAIAPQ